MIARTRRVIVRILYTFVGVGEFCHRTNALAALPRDAERRDICRVVDRRDDRCPSTSPLPSRPRRGEGVCRGVGRRRKDSWPRQGRRRICCSHWRFWRSKWLRRPRRFGRSRTPSAGILDGSAQAAGEVGDAAPSGFPFIRHSIWRMRGVVDRDGQSTGILSRLHLARPAFLRARELPRLRIPANLAPLVSSG